MGSKINSRLLKLGLANHFDFLSYHLNFLIDFVVFRSTVDGKDEPYEINISWWSAMSSCDETNNDFQFIKSNKTNFISHWAK